MDHPRRHTFVKGLFGQLAPSAARPRRPEDRPRVGFSSARCSTPERREVQEDSRENDQLASTSPGLPCLADTRCQVYLSFYIVENANTHPVTVQLGELHRTRTQEILGGEIRCMASRYALLGAYPENCVCLPRVSAEG